MANRAHILECFIIVGEAKQQRRPTDVFSLDAQNFDEIDPRSVLN